MNLGNIKNIIIYFIALMFNMALVYLFIDGNEIPAAFWAVYAAVNAPLGISIAFNGIKALKK